MAGKRAFLGFLAWALLGMPGRAERPSLRHLHRPVSKAVPAAAGRPGSAALPAGGTASGASGKASDSANAAAPGAPAAGHPTAEIPGAPAPPAPESLRPAQPLPPPAGGAKPVLVAAFSDAPKSKADSAAARGKMDSLLKTGAIGDRDEDSADEAEADSADAASAAAGSAPPGAPREGSSKSGLPFPMKKPSKKEIAAFQRAVLGAVTAIGKEDFAKARKVLENAQPTERLAQVYRTILMSTIYHGLKDYRREDSVLNSTLEWVGGRTWRSYLLNRRIQAFPATDPGDSARLEFTALVLQSPVSASVKINFLYDLLRLQGFAGDPEGFDLPLKRIVASARADRRLDSLYRMLAPRLPPGSGTWERQDMMIDLETKLGLFPAAIARCEAALKLVPGVPEKRRLHWSYATLLYRDKDYSKAIDSYMKWIERYGESADAILQIARSYDRQQEPKKAILWYDKLLEKYPRHDKTSEIYWLRAWDQEAAGNYTEAIEFYYRQLSEFSANRRGDWANFRVGLCQYKAGNPAAALQAFRAIRDQTGSNAYPAGLFWESRAQDSLGDTAAAHAALIELAEKYPFNFYGHLARQALQDRHAWPDSLDSGKRFAASTPAAIKAWMKSGMSGFRDDLGNGYESEYLPLGKLLQFRLDTLAILTWRTIPGRVKNNPWFLYVYARKFQERGLWRESYRMGLQLGYKIPADRWGYAPREVLRLMYPRPYEGLVQKYALRRKLDPAFVYALMRQESAFDHEIKSGAGAVGLMQLMPATAKAVARREKWARFDAYSLSEPEVNISLGTAYLRDLRKDYEGSLHWILANYNAGPEPTRRWRAAAALPAPAGPSVAAVGMAAPGAAAAAASLTPGTWATAGERPLDAVVEDISYWETRDYVKKVMGNYWTYRALWNNRGRSR